MSKSSTCGLLGVSRQVYYRSLRTKATKQDKASRVVSLAGNIRRDMPRIGFRKLYHILYEPLKALKVGRDKFLSILKANHMSRPKSKNNKIIFSAFLTKFLFPAINNLPVSAKTAIFMVYFK